MKPSRGAFVLAATVVALTAGCSATDRTATRDDGSPAVIEASASLDGVRFDVRRDPG